MRTTRFLIMTAIGLGILLLGEGQAAKRFTDNRDGTVTDTKTGLMWLKNANFIKSNAPDFDRDDKSGDGKVTYEHAINLVQRANRGNPAVATTQYKDWRLPVLKELNTLPSHEPGNILRISLIVNTQIAPS